MRPSITLHRALKFAGEAFQGLWFVRAVSATFIEASSSCANFFTRFDPPNPFNSFDPLLAAYAPGIFGIFPIGILLGFGVWDLPLHGPFVAKMSIQAYELTGGDPTPRAL